MKKTLVSVVILLVAIASLVVIVVFLPGIMRSSISPQFSELCVLSGELSQDAQAVGVRVVEVLPDGTTRDAASDSTVFVYNDAYGVLTSADNGVPKRAVFFKRVHP